VETSGYRQRHKVEIMFGRLKEWRRIHTRYDRCAQLRQPGLARRILARHAHHSGGSKDQQLAEIPVTLLADPTKPLLAT
jgi:transposase